MGVDTRALLVGGQNHIEIAEALASIYGCDPVIRSGVSWDEAQTHFMITFPVPGDETLRMMHVHLDYVQTEDDDSKVYPHDEPGTLLSLGKWGHSVEIMEALCARFSGYVLDEDTGSVAPRFIDVSAEGAAPPPLSPAAEASIAIARILGPEQSAVMRAVLRDEDKVDAVIAILEKFRDSPKD